jgi:hypothetical protein
MSRHLPLLTRLRRHRGLWVLAVLLIKLATSSICLGDGAGNMFASSASTTVSLSVAAPADQASADDAACLLGEAGDCHCTCAHTMPLPTSGPLPIARMDVHFEPLTIHSGFEATTIASLLRPPIA